jgi:tetratricopeptide (TPR) repeat protein
VRKLSPRDPLTFVVDTFEGLANYLLGNHEAAVDWSQKAIRKNPDFVYPHFHLAAACGQLGRLDEAGDALTAGGNLQADLSEAFFKSVWPLTNSDHLEAYFDGLRKAGLTEI